MATKKQKTGLRVHIVEVTPQLAKEWLDRNHRNRGIRPAQVDAYARDMADGKWTLNGEAIKFACDDEETLLDGQHRLHAVIQSGVTVHMVVVEGLPLDTQDTMDSGIKRTAADMLSLLGETNANVLAALARRVVAWDCMGTKSLSSKAYKPTHAEIRDVLETYPELRKAADLGTRGVKYVDLSATVLAFCYWVLSSLDAADADGFFDSLITGANLGKTNPVLVLRTKLRDARQSPKRTPEHILIAYVFKAWNAVREGRSMSLLRLTPDETFPVPR